MKENERKTLKEERTQLYEEDGDTLIMSAFYIHPPQSPLPSCLFFFFLVLLSILFFFVRNFTIRSNINRNITNQSLISLLITQVLLKIYGKSTDTYITITTQYFHTLLSRSIQHKRTYNSTMIRNIHRQNPLLIDSETTIIGKESWQKPIIG